MSRTPTKASTRAALPCGRKPEAHSHAASPAQREAWRGKLKAHLQSKGLKQSTQRDKIVEQIMAIERHFSAQEMVTRIRSRFPGIGMATVYRTLKLLVEAQILKETLLGSGGQQVYELASDDHHDHIVCLDCGAIFEFHDEAIEETQERVTTKLRFREVRHRHVIYAHCGMLENQRSR
jgi:Fur family ferric uptake transcriptional regulator